ncbi:MAG TPA: DUF2339 domain-containing protein [Thermoanaerobaculia bacterium]|nr:DUF2339 domain-containing protein [Thermoanaerobaculia bacterium]
MTGCVITAMVGLIVAGAGGVYGFSRWLDRRRQELRRLAQLEHEVTSLAGELWSLRSRLEALEPGSPSVSRKETVEPPAGAPVRASSPPPDSAPPASAPPPPFDAAATTGSIPEHLTAGPEDSARESPQNLPGAEAPELPSSEPPSAPPPSPPIDWERWIGVRGAALVAGILLALAGIYFVRYWIEAGLLTPPLRVALGWIGGVAAVLGSESLRKRGYGNPANGLAGAGVVGLYAATWAAHDLYQLIPPWIALGVMGLVTVAGGLLAWRHASAVIAVLGLLGGFATPLLVSSAEQGPLTLFGYLLLLNLGVAAVGRRFGWPWLSLLGLVLTVGYQALWMLEDLDAGGVWLALLVLGVFAALYLAAGRLTAPLASDREEDEAPEPVLGVLRQLAGLASPFLFALYFAARADLEVELWSLFLLLGPLTVAACWLGRRHRQPFYELTALGANLAVGAIWTFGEHPPLERAWQASGFALALALVHHLFFERDRRRDEVALVLPATLAAGALLVGLALAPMAEIFHPPVEPGGFIPYLAGWTLLALLLLRQSALAVRGLPSGLAGFGAGVAFALAVLLGNERRLELPEPLLLLAIAAIALIGLQVWAIGRLSRVDDHDARTHRAWVGAEVGAALASSLVLASLAFCIALYQEGAGLHHTVLLLFGALAALPALRARSAPYYALVVLLLAGLQSGWHLEREGAALHALLLQLATVAAVTLLPLFSRPPLASLPARLTMAVAGGLWFPSLYELWLNVLPGEVYGEARVLGALPVLLGLIALAGAARAAVSLEDPQRKSALAWLGAAALGWAAIAVPLQLEKEWVTVAWALEALAVTALWRRLDHAGLKLFALALHAAVFVRLAFNPALLSDYPAFSAGGLPIVNWLLYTYGVPIAALLLSARQLASIEVERARPAERGLYARGKPVLAGLYSLLAVVLGFVWLNLTVFDAFAPGTGLALPTERLAARDLTLSLSWALYAFLLLGLGVARRSSALRWISLVFLVLAIGKTFLYDLGELADLYRVASLAGLAITLLLVSILYQRFVFGRDRRARVEPVT